MKLKRPAVLLLLFLLLASAYATVLKTYAPGVVSGDYFTYEMYGVFTSNRSNATLVIPQFEYNNTEWVRISISRVEGSMVYQVYTLHFNNGSETEFSYETNVNPDNQSSVFSGQSVPICATNMGAGERIPTAELTINDTTSRTYVGGLRQINHVEWNSTDDWGNCYFDRETGMPVEFLRTHRFTNNDTGEVVLKTDVINLISTNRWQISAAQSPSALYFVVLTAGILVFSSLVVMVHSLFSRKKHNRTVTTETANYE
jgi:hypothetical protein